MANETLNVVSFSEFINTIRKDYLVETIGGFSYWIQKEGMPQKLPFAVWKSKLDRYLKRKV